MSKMDVQFMPAAAWFPISTSRLMLLVSAMSIGCGKGQSNRLKIPGKWRLTISVC